ncbi:MAG: hypothetical protein IJ911_05330 [Salinivirgaceae bacterium]|nr:hypothetical protein [Salinivirgaceae bacterium]
MTLRHIFSIAILLLVTLSVSAQDSESEQQYKAAMQNAKTAFDAKMYSEALYFYREALKINPDAKLPRYKIEDIRTIYIDDGIKEIAENKQIAQEEVKKQAEAKADERIEAEVVQAQKELETLKVAMVISIDEEPMVEDDVVEIADVEPTLETKPIEPEPEPQPEPIEPEPIVTQPVEPVIEEPKPKEKAIEQPAPKAEEPAPKPVQPAPKPAPAKTVSKPTQKPVSQPKQMSDEEKKAWKENEIKKLRQQYPEQKTVLEFDQPGKHITRIIMNVDNEIMVYLKVKHSWGATFFFVEEIGEDLRSIDEVTFNKKTNLQNYGH